MKAVAFVAAVVWLVSWLFFGLFPGDPVWYIALGSGIICGLVVVFVFRQAGELDNPSKRFVDDVLDSTPVANTPEGEGSPVLRSLVSVPEDVSGVISGPDDISDVIDAWERSDHWVGWGHAGSMRYFHLWRKRDKYTWGAICSPEVFAMDQPLPLSSVEARRCPRCEYWQKHSQP